MSIGTHNNTRRLLVLPVGDTGIKTRRALDALFRTTCNNDVIRVIHADVYEEDETTGFDMDTMNSWIHETNIGTTSEGSQPISVDIVKAPTQSIIQTVSGYVESVCIDYPDCQLEVHIPMTIPASWFARVFLHGRMGKLLYSHLKKQGYAVYFLPVQV